MKKRTAYRLLLAVALSVLFCMFAAAEQQGYIFELKENAPEQLRQLAAQQTALSEENGVYLTTDASLVLQIRKNRAAEYCEPDEEVRLEDYGEEIAALQTDDWKRSMVGYGYAKTNGITGKGVRVGIIDSGLAACFGEQSAAAIEKGYNYIDGSEDDSDTYGHGTFVASVIAHRDYGIAGEVSIIPLKAFDDKTSYLSNIVAAIYAAADDYDCDVLNMSFSVANDRENLQAAISHAAEKGVIMVAAAGNSGTTAICYPAGYDCVIGVGSLDSGKTIAASSQKNESIFVSAPGVSVAGMKHDGKIYISGGTSYAAPLVTAAAALARSVDPDLTPEEFAQLLKSSAEDLGQTGWDSSYGWGLLNVGLLLAMQRGDTQSLIFSTYTGGTCVSFAETENEENEVIAAFYDEYGQMLGLNMYSCAAVSNAPVMQNTKELTVLVLQNDTKQLLKAR